MLLSRPAGSTGGSSSAPPPRAPQRLRRPPAARAAARETCKLLGGLTWAPPPGRRRWPPAPRPPRAASEGGDSGAAGADDDWGPPEIAVQLSSPQGSQLAYILQNSSGPSQDALFEPAVRTYLQELQRERDAEAEMEAAAAADAAAERAAAAAEEEQQQQQQQQQQGQGMDAAETWNDGELMRRITALREAERGRVVADVVYLEALRRLDSARVRLVHSVALLAPPARAPPGFVSERELAALASRPVADAVLSYLASSFSGGDAELMDAASPARTPLSVDRVQAARLFAGILEFGYFAAALEAACEEAGVALGEDSAAMIAHADSLPEAELRALCAVRSADGWWAAVRHVGEVFGLRPNEDPFDSFALPYPELSVTISQIQMESAESLYEYYRPPGTAAKLAARAADRAARGWGAAAEPDGGELPDADLVTFELGMFKRSLLEAAVFGVVLHGVERRVEREYGYELACRREREAQQESG